MTVGIKKSYKHLLADSPLTGSNVEYLESLYEIYQENPQKLPQYWQNYFRQFIATTEKVSPNLKKEIKLSEVRREFESGQANTQENSKEPPASTHVEIASSDKQVKVLQLINAFRFMGHLEASTNPLTYKKKTVVDDLKLETHGLSISDLGAIYNTGSLAYKQNATLKEVLEILTQTYCGSVGAEYMHITNTGEKRWIQTYLESQRGMSPFGAKFKKQIFKKLAAAEGLEKYLHTRYAGQKRFSLEGAEALIPMLNEMIYRAGVQGSKELVIGMAHRGRLNVLTNIMGKTPADLFREFEGRHTKQFSGSGDVKYHLGFSSNIKTPGGIMHVVLAFNPSHLEIVAPVVEGSVRARQDRRNDTDGFEVIPVNIHGDAAFAGQGVVMETFNMSQSRGYSTKGTVHIVINNQIGFTTSNQADARSTLYCTDVAKMVNAPIFHVNGDDPEAAIYITQLALDYRMTFNKDVVIDLVCYRRHGHSEADEPMATQPLMYQAIKEKATALALYEQKLMQEQILADVEIQEYKENYRKKLSLGEVVVDTLIDSTEVEYPYDADWSPFIESSITDYVETKLDPSRIKSLGTSLCEVAPGFELHANVARILHLRKLMVAGEIRIDWGFAECLAYASLVKEGYAVRLSGQDSGRGTFFHRHATIHNQQGGDVYIPLRHIAPDQANFLVINSLLSEEAVLAFEYGYATTDPNTLTIWEAQFGDFANNAQVVIDQFISAGEQKWDRMCGLVLLLPHGFEGQGPEHSSARLERYLQLCAQQNMQVCCPTNAAQIFHLLRRQMLIKSRKPLIIMTPKSLLRHKDASCSLKELSEGSFKRVIASSVQPADEKVARVIMCSGRVYYDLLNWAKTNEVEDTAIVRIEQLFPFPEDALISELQRYSNVKIFVWCQEEPMNQGAWYASQHHIRATIGRDKALNYAGRAQSAAPAVGLYSLHHEQMEQFLKTAFSINEIYG